MGLDDDIKRINTKAKKIEKEVSQLQEQSLAMELLKDQRKQNKRTFLILLVVLVMWFITIGIFVYYISTNTIETITEEATTDMGGNACVGDSCNNGEISYGNSKKNN